MKYAFVTGSDKGIGKAIAEALLKRNFYVFIHYFQDQQSAQKTLAEFRKKYQRVGLLCGDIRKYKAVQQIVQQLTQVTPKLDLLVNNAGIDYDFSLEDYGLDKMHEVIETDLWGTIQVTKLLLPILQQARSAQIINIASRMGQAKVIPGVSAYAPAKAGVIHFTKCCALELAKYHIRANVVCPGMTATTLAKKNLPGRSFCQCRCQKPLP